SGFVHTNARINGGIEDESLSRLVDPQRAQAGVYIHSSVATDIFSAVRNGVLSGHLTFKDMTVRISQGGMLVPRSLEALRAPIQILTGGSAFGQPVLETGQNSWGTATNKARIRNVAGDGLRVFNGGALNSPVGPIHLDISGCTGDGVRLDMGSTASFGPPNGDDGLVTKGAANRKFGMNVRNASRAIIGKDRPADRLTGSDGDVALDDGPRHLWSEVTLATPLSNAGMSLVRVNK
ncbi:MAG TPA: hypothetical protein VJM12_11010, partial [Pyrinomonadaceae bacterium]|nr:hypothetical protein [Pyrinomonadaceae bacterium]